MKINVYLLRLNSVKNFGKRGKSNDGIAASTAAAVFKKHDTSHRANDQCHSRSHSHPKWRERHPAVLY